MMLLTILLVCAPGFAAADQYDSRLEPLFDDLRSGEGDPDTIVSDIQSIWLTAPEAGLNVLVERVVSAMEAGDNASAAVLIGHLTGLAPHYAEGWVMKGHLAMLEEDRVTATIAFQKAIALEPRHFYALEMLGDLALMSGHDDRAFGRYREALDINPYLENARSQMNQLRRQMSGQEI
ncbi:hypothetical protein [Parvularcula sp. LCG005]|uniref:tetratricopeptide repeat protein n=1 Tax=Parvularcula sp. LCG005 TaxID=3078805 RepID=UPI0029432713|nr:hypothetical protein [Parvularcula sp. LCG005]WOI53600.1 hypothetical protein RUI03_01065 [Parvularcula sp. LCG005]